MSWARRCGFPAWVMPPRRVRSPLESSDGTRPVNPMNMPAVGKRRQSHTSDAKVSAPRWVIPR